MVRMAKVWTVRGGDPALINCGDLYESVMVWQGTFWS